ncbi:MAG: FAD-binding protein [Candidatus Aenigmarchaeota archaeon]|nr:FAD-binding protein [Candidatus Aenigmarchaeota archaeon]
MEVVRQTCDVLVIGAGAAGLRAAIAASDLGQDVLLLGKSKHGDAHTNLATGGVNAALATVDKDDTWAVHAADTLREGEHLADPRLVEILCQQAPAAITELADWGARFAKGQDGRLIQRFFGAHTFRRTCFYGDETGMEMMRVLVGQAAKRNIRTLESVFIFKLLAGRDGIDGAAGLDLASGKVLVVGARAVVLAAGGYSRIYSISSSRAFENLGDGVALAFDAGCTLADLEMVQFHPTGMVWPKAMEGILVTEAVRGEGGILTNRKGERFMQRYDPERMELSARDVVARAIYHEIIDGNGTEHNGAWLDISFQPAAYIQERLPKMVQQFQDVGVDITQQKMEIAPTGHYSMGGVVIDANCKTSVAGLFAAGEVTAGVHGANRLGGNSLAETVVFGKIAGQQAAKHANGRPEAKPEAVTALAELRDLDGAGQERPAGLQEQAQQLMWRHAGIVRDRAGLEKGLEQLLRLKARLNGAKAPSMQGVAELLDARNVLLCSELVLRAALQREESRGAHYHQDFPEQKDGWRKRLVCSRQDGRMAFGQASLPEPGPEVRDALTATGKARHKPLE